MYTRLQVGGPLAAHRMRWSLYSLLAFSLLLAACAGTTIDTAERDISPLTPRTVVAGEVAGDAGGNPSPSNLGATVLWGGMILSSTNLADSTRLEILGYPLDRAQRPMQGRDAEGRFLVDIDGYVETADYAEGRLVTVLGTLAESVDGAIGEARYRWPRLQADQWHLWRPGEESQQPRFTFGIGVNLSN